MSRYFFHVGDSDGGLDLDGMELPDVNAAHIQAATTMGEMLRDKPGQFWDERCMQLIVTDKAGLILFVLGLTAIEAPALRRTKTRRSALGTPREA